MTLDWPGIARNFQFCEKNRFGNPHTGLRFRIASGAFVLLAGLPVAFAQLGTADAIVVKIPGANILSTVSFTASGGSVFGQNVSIPLTLSLGGTTKPESFQLDLSFDPTKLTFVSVSASGLLTGAGMGLSSSVVSASDVHLATTGANQNGVSGGVAAYASFTLAAPLGPTGAAVMLVNCMSEYPLGNPLSTGCTAGTVGLVTCDVNGDGSVGAVDVQTMINEALGVRQAVNDMNQDGVVNVADIEMVIGAALGRGCLY